MPLRVICCCAYPTAKRIWGQDDYNAKKLVDALKARPVNGYGELPLPTGASARFNQESTDVAMTWVARRALDAIRLAGVGGPFAVVPIPHASCDVHSDAPPRMIAVAERMAMIRPGEVAVEDILRWDRPMKSASAAGGSREPRDLYAFLRVIDDVPELPMVLLDDVLTSGGHLQAAAAVLVEAGGTITVAICGVRALAETVDGEQFAFSYAILDDYLPR